MSPNSADNWEFTEFVFRHILFSMVFLLGKEGNGGQLHTREAWLMLKSVIEMAECHVQVLVAGATAGNQVANS